MRGLKNKFDFSIIKFHSASPSEKAEVKRVRELFSSDQCINQGLFDSFQIQNPEGEQSLPIE